MQYAVLLSATAAKKRSIIDISPIVRSSFAADLLHLFFALTEVMDSLVDDTLIQIFLRINDPKTLANCALTCRRWAAILASSSPFWITKCKYDRRVIPTALLISHAPQIADKIDYRIIWLKNPYGRNLIKNDSGQSGFKYWTLNNDNWTKSQRVQDGSNVEVFPIEKPPRAVDGDFECCFATSHFQCEKTQIVDLWSEGVQPWILDELKPPIVVSEWHAGPRDCGSLYQIDVCLQNSKEEICGEYHDERRVAQWSDGKWEQSLHRFTNYAANVRYVVFKSGGRDSQFWAGFYGAKMAKASVAVELN